MPRPRRVEALGGDTVYGLPRFSSETGLMSAEEAERVYREIAPAGGRGPEVVLADRPPAGVEAGVLGGEGYVLRVEGGSGVLYAGSRGGLVHGLSVLAQLAAQGWRGGVEVVDYPAFGYRGVVEGFYFEPWSWADRRDVLRFMAWARMNSYIYAPKDDPYHREKWRLGYPEELLREIGGLAGLARLLGIGFVFAVSPGLSAVYSSEGDLETLVAKYLSVAGHGVRSFGLFYDDIPEELLHEEDRARYGSLAEAHADFANRVYRRLREELGEVDLIVVPTEYRGVEMGPYFRELGERLDPAIKLMWTGPEVCSTEITLEQARAVSRLSRGRLLVWDNYPVNDYARNRLNLGPLRGRDPQLPEALEGFLFNPMNEAWASRIPLSTAADYAWNPGGYDPDRSFSETLALLYGGAAPQVELLASMLGYSTLWPSVPPGIDDAVSAARSGVYGPVEELLGRLAGLPDAILGADARLYGEAEPYLYRLALEAWAGLEFLAALGAPGPGAAWARLARGLELWREARAVYHIAGAVSRHREEVWYTFVERDFLGELLHALASAAARVVHGSLEVPWVFSNADHVGGHDWSRAVDGDEATWYVSRRSYMPEGARFELSLGGRRGLAVELRQLWRGGAEAPADLVVEADGGECRPPCAVEASCLVVRAAGVARGRRGLQLVAQPLAPRVVSDIRSTTYASNIVDGRADTFLEVPPGSGGRRVIVDLGGRRRVERVVVLQSPGSAARLRVYVAAPGLVYPLLHLDSVEWVPVGRARGHYSVVPVGAETGYVRLEVEGGGGGRIHQVIVE